jgi:lysophospholipase L1-like esterase
MTTHFTDAFDDAGRTTLGANYTVIGGGWTVGSGNAVSTGNISTAARSAGITGTVGPIQHISGVVGVLGTLYLFTHVGATGTISYGARLTSASVSIVNASRTVVSGTSLTVAAAIGDTVDLYHNETTKTVTVYYNGTLASTYTYTGDFSANRAMAMGTGSTGAGWSSITGDDIAAPGTGGGTDTTPPAVPAGLALTPGVQSLSFSFTAVSDSDLDHYELRYGTANPPTGTWVSIGTATSGSQSGLAANVTYYAQVRSVDATGNISAASSVASATTTASTDTTAPTVPTAVDAVATSATQVAVTWTASTDAVGVTGYRVLRDGILIGTPTATSYTDTTVSASSSYTYTVQAYDAAGNVSASSTGDTVTTPAASGDVSAPTVTLGSPSSGATLTGTVAVTGTASDNTGVTSVSILLNGSSVLGFATITGGSWSYSWNTTTTANGTWSLTARAADAAGNLTSTSAISVTVSNAVNVADPAAVILEPGHRLTYWNGTQELPVRVDGFTEQANAYQYEGVDGIFLGDSIGDMPGNVPISPGARYDQRLATRLKLFSRTNRHVNGDTVQDAALRAIGTSKPFAVPQYGLVVVVAGTNDVGFHHGQAAGLTGYSHGVRTIASLCRAASIIPSASATSVTGTWTTVTSTAGSGGSYRGATAPGASMTFTFTGTDASVVLVGPSDGTGSAFQVSVDGAVKFTGTTINQALPTANFTTSVFPVCVLLRGLGSGSHTVVVTHTGASGNPLGVNALLPWGTAPAQLCILEPIKASTAGWANYPTPRPVDADVDPYRTRLAQVIAEFPQGGSLIIATPDALEGKNATHAGSDNLHPNDRGHSVLAQILNTVLQTTTWRNGLNRSIRAV